MSSLIRHLYAEFCSFNWLGPILINTDPTDHRFQQCLERILGCLDVRSTEIKSIQTAASPWDAALYLHLLARHLAAGQPDAFVRMLFRGQPSHSYHLFSTLRRWEQNGKSPSLAVRWMETFLAALDAAYHHGELASPGQRSLEALGRHLGIPSTLLDFSADPSVAVFFACCGAERGKTATVWALPSSTALTQMRVYLPPPLCKRLYLQRGIFVETANLDFDHLEAECVQLEFPADPDFRVHRNGKIIDLCQPDPWLDRLSVWARKQAEVGVPAEPAKRNRIFATLFDEIGYHPGFVRPVGTGHLTLEWYEAIGDILYWILWLVTVDEHGVDREGVFEDELEGIVRDNCEAMLMWADLLEAEAIVDQRRGLADRAAGRRDRVQHIRKIGERVCGKEVVSRFMGPKRREG